MAQLNNHLRYIKHSYLFELKVMCAGLMRILCCLKMLIMPIQNIVICKF